MRKKIAFLLAVLFTAWGLQAQNISNSKEEKTAIFGNDGEMGIKDKNGQTLVPPDNFSITKLSPDHYMVYKTRDSMGLYSAGQKGSVIYEFSRTYFPDVKYPFLFAKKDGKWGIINKETGKPSTTFKYPLLLKYSEDMAQVRDDDLRGLITLDGKEILPVKYQKLGVLSNGVLTIVQNDKYGLADVTGKILLEPQYDLIYKFTDSVSTYKLGDKTGYINNKGQILSKLIYDNAYSSENGFSVYQIGDKWGYFSIEEEKDITPNKRYDKCSNFTASGLGEVTLNGLSGYVDTKGNEAIPAKYSKIYLPAEGICVFEENKLFGYVNTSGKEIAKARFETATAFKNGIATVSENGKYGLLNTKGDFLVSPTYKKVYAFSNGYAIYDRDGRYGYLSESGNEITDAVFNAGKGFFEEGTAIVAQNNKWGMINNKGNIIVPFEYDSIELDYTGNKLVARKGFKRERFSKRGEKLD